MITLKKRIKEFVGVINLLTNFNEETNFTFKKDKLIVKIIDTAGISLCNITFDKIVFEEYDITDEITYTLNLETLLKIVKKVGKKEMNIIATKDKLVFENSKDSFKMNFYVGVEDIRAKPVFDYEAHWIVDSAELINNVSDLISFSGICKLYCDEDTIGLYTKGILIEGSTLLDSTKIKSIPSFCWYDLAYFLKIADIKNIAPKIDIFFSQVKPLNVIAENNGIKIDWILAPRVEEDGQ